VDCGISPESAHPRRRLSPRIDLHPALDFEGIGFFRATLHPVPSAARPPASLADGHRRAAKNPLVRHPAPVVAARGSFRAAGNAQLRLSVQTIARPAPGTRRPAPGFGFDRVDPRGCSHVGDGFAHVPGAISTDRNAAPSRARLRRSNSGSNAPSAPQPDAAAIFAAHARDLGRRRRSRAPGTAPGRAGVAVRRDWAPAARHVVPVPDRNRIRARRNRSPPPLGAAAARDPDGNPFPDHPDRSPGAHSALLYGQSGRTAEARPRAPRPVESPCSAIRRRTFPSGARLRAPPHELLDGDL